MRCRRDDPNTRGQSRFKLNMPYEPRLAQMQQLDLTWDVDDEVLENTSFILVSSSDYIITWLAGAVASCGSPVGG